MPSGVLAIGMSVALTPPAPSGRSELTKARVVSFPPMANTCVSLTGCVAVQPCLRAPPPAPAPYRDSLNTHRSLRPPRGESCSWAVRPCWQGDGLPLGKPALQPHLGRTDHAADDPQIRRQPGCRDSLLCTRPRRLRFGISARAATGHVVPARDEC